MSIEEKARDIAYSMRADMNTILRVYLGREHTQYDLMLEELVDAGMFHVEHLLVCQACDEQRGKVGHE